MSIRIQNFGPQQSYKIATTTASSVGQAVSQVAPPDGNPLQAWRFANNATGVAWVTWGKGTATAVTTNTGGSHPVLPGEDFIFDVPPGMNFAAAILESGTGNVYLSIGEGS